VLWPLTTGNKKKFNIDFAVFDTFRGFLHTIYAATMDGKGRESTYNFSHDDMGSRSSRSRAREQLPPPLPPRWRRPRLAVILCFIAPKHIRNLRWEFSREILKYNFRRPLTSAARCSIAWRSSDDRAMIAIVRIYLNVRWTLYDRSCSGWV